MKTMPSLPAARHLPAASHSGVQFMYVVIAAKAEELALNIA